ncbi:hypothetical protein OURE66S_03862 [Oligella ureolytica]
MQFDDISRGSVPSELSIELKEWINSQTSSQKGLDKPNRNLLANIKAMAATVMSDIKGDKRQSAMKNFDENMDKSISGTALNVPENIRKWSKQQTTITQPTTTSQKLVKEKRQEKESEL